MGSNITWKNTSRINIWGNGGAIKIGNSFSMGYNSELYSWNERLLIGDNTSINDNCKIYGNVQIGSNCLLASNIFISSGSHNFSYNPVLPIKTQDKLTSVNKPIIIEDDCWIGFGVVVMPGVYIGKGAIIGSNAVITKDVFPYSIQGGIPASAISKRLDFSSSFSCLKSEESNHWPYFYRGCNYSQFNDLAVLKSGIEMKETSIVLLKKMPVKELMISGYSYMGLRVKLFLNSTMIKELHIDSGIFESLIHVTNSEAENLVEFDQLSAEIKEKFDVVVMKVYPVDQTKALSDLWKITSIGYYEV